MAIKIICKNKRASFDYSLLKKIEAGLVLKGTEVKSLRAGKASLSESFVQIDSNLEAYLHNMTIAHYEFGNRENHKETRKRKLLLHKKEIEDLYHRVKAERLSLVPTIIYFKEGKIKLEFALAKGKKLYDKRQDMAKKDSEKKIKRDLGL